MWHILIFIAALLTTCMSLDSNSNSNSQEPKYDTKRTISIIRKYGFFSNYDSLSDDQLYNLLHESRIKSYSVIFGKYYDPGMNLSEREVLALDTLKVVYLDLEFDVGKGNEAYIKVLKAFASASNGWFNPTEIKESWQSESGPIKVTFKNNGNTIEFEPEYIDDWLSEKVFEIIHYEMKRTGKDIFYLYLGKSGLELGQDVLHIRLSIDQKERIEKDLKWKLH